MGEKCSLKAGCGYILSSLLRFFLTKEALFSEWRELPLLLYEVVGALLLKVLSPFSSSTAGQKPRTWHLSGMWNDTEGCWLERNLSGGCVLSLCHSPPEVPDSLATGTPCILQWKLCLPCFSFISFLVCMFIMCVCKHLCVWVHAHACHSLNVEVRGKCWVSVFTLAHPCLSSLHAPG